MDTLAHSSLIATREARNHSSTHDPFSWLRSLTAAQLEAQAMGYSFEMAEAYDTGDVESLEFLRVGFDAVRSVLGKRERYGLSQHPLADVAPLASIGDLKSAVTLTQVMEALSGCEFTWRGKTAWSLCFSHKEQTPSLHADDEKGLWYCHSCHEGGDVITFTMQAIAAQSFSDAIRAICAAAGLDPAPYLIQRNPPPVSPFPPKQAAMPPRHRPNQRRPAPRFVEYRGTELVRR